MTARTRRAWRRTLPSPARPQGVSTRTSTLLQEGVSYNLSTLAAGVDVTKYTSGRVFVSLGSPLTGLTATNNYAPNFVSPTSPNFLTRMDKYEITYGVPASGGARTGGANLSSTDFFGIPLQLQTKGGSEPTTLTWNYNGAVNTAAVFQNLGALEGYETDTSSNSLGALVANGANGVTINTPDGPMNGVVRIIAPSSTNGNTTPFPSFANYVNYLQANGISATIEGQNGQFSKGGPYQNYDLTGVISKTSGDLVLTGTVTNASGGTNSLTIVVTKANLSSFAIYGANPAYTVTVGSDTNKVVEKVIADYFAGLNFGLIGSTAPNPNNPGHTIGTSPSWTWYGNQPNGGGPKPLPLSDPYAAAAGQPRLLQYVRRLSEQQQRPGDGRLWLSLHGPARKSFGASRRQHDPDNDHPARHGRVQPVGLDHHRPGSEYGDVCGLARRPHPVLDAHGHRRRNGDSLR